jgi:DNA-binding beta-propeller fold protein YncE
VTRPLVLVASMTARKLDFFDAETFEKLATIDDLIATPHEIALDPGRRLAYIAHPYRSGGYSSNGPKAHEISVIDIEQRRLVSVIDIHPYVAPHDIAFDSINDLIYVGVERQDGRNGLVGVDPVSRRVAVNIATEAPNSHWISLTPDGRKAYIAHKEAPFVSVLDLIEGRLASTIGLPGGTEEIDCSPDGMEVFVVTPHVRPLAPDANRQAINASDTSPPGTRVVKIDTLSDQVIGEVDLSGVVDGTVFALCVSSAGLVAACEWAFPKESNLGPTPGRIFIIDGRTMTFVGSILGDEQPFTTRFSPDGAIAYVANAGTGSVSVVDMATRSTVARLDNNMGGDFGGTHGLCYVGPD